MSTIYLIGSISRQRIKILIETIWETFQKSAFVDLAIESGGGDFLASQMFFEEIRKSNILLTTFGYEISSSAALVFLAGKRRIVYPYTRMGLHPIEVHFAGNTELSTDEIEEFRKDLVRMNTRYAQILSEVSNGKISAPDIWQRIVNRDTLGGEELVHLGLAHEIRTEGV